MVDNDIVSVFVCHFHVKKGNLVEWSYPPTYDLCKEDAAVEFKSLPSGAHLVEADTVLFRVGDLFGISHLRNVKVRSESVENSQSVEKGQDERGSRLRSIGFICRSVNYFEQYRKFLTTDSSVSSIFEEKHCETFDALENFVKEQNEQMNPASDSICPYMFNCGFPSLVETFGVQLLVLWKLSLMNLKILFYSSPPLYDICCKLFPISMLSNSKYSKTTDQSTYHNSSITEEIDKLECDSCHVFLDKNRNRFYVSLLDLSSKRDKCFEDGIPYVACTSDKVVEETMQNCYDVFVNGTEIRTWRKDLKSVIKPTKADRQRLDDLKRLAAFHSESPPEETHNVFVQYFTTLNDQILKVLLQKNAYFEGDSPDDSFAPSDRTSMMNDSLIMGELSNAHISGMGLNPTSGDMDFIQEMVAQLDLNLIVVKEGGCCPFLNLLPL